MATGGDLTDNPNEIAVLRARLHGMANDVQNHGVKLELHNLELANLKESIKTLADNTATSDQLTAATQIVQLKLDRMGDDVSTMKSAMVWTVRVVVGAVLLAVIALVIRSGGVTP